MRQRNSNQKVQGSGLAVYAFTATTFMLLIAVSTASLYKDNPETPFNYGISAGWWLFGFSCVACVLYFCFANRKSEDFPYNMFKFLILPVISLIGVVGIYFLRAQL
ncbi:hypothetical protein ACFQAR_18135 [Acinetobacter beijerinckii]|uniref:Uncharacterized protein n=2 Tax=Acinetobacter beijerinckii TaxID=262668 RepID=N9FDH7_9GAMM|nr:hypothetical protein F933_03330 [Acinetobacter beijerinckii CIP 110307]